MCQYSFNPYLTDQPLRRLEEYEAFDNDDITPFHRSIPGYQPTPLVRLPNLAARLGVGEIFVKDESHRFGLKAFKAMGASYAAYRFIKQQWERQLGVRFELANLYHSELLSQLGLRPLCTATDGNHGRALAWFARLINHRAVVYVPSSTVAARIENIRREGAQVVVIEGDYDETVRRMAGDAERHGWHVVSDTSYSGYKQIPSWIMAGYTTMFREIADASRANNDEGDFSHVFVQAGVGSFAAAAAWFYGREKKSPVLIAVEPTEADCLLESVRHGGGEPRTSCGGAKTIMAGLNCRTPSLIAWPLIRDKFGLFLSVSDDYSRGAMRQFHSPRGGDSRIISGESGAAGLAALMAIVESDRLAPVRSKIKIRADSRILIFNTEGDTDPGHFRRVVEVLDD
jgi:diaminopropionate ammonia-lyase